ncbi:MAG: SRPBCC family protein [Myxococcota bacterium]
MHITRSVEVNAPAKRVWALLGEGFAELTWARTISSSRLEGALGVGAVRVCTFEPSLLVSAGAARERLVEFEPQRGVFAYELLEPSAPIRSAGSRWQVEEAGVERSRVTVASTIALTPMGRMLSPLVRLMTLRLMRSTFADLEAGLQQATPTARRTPPQPGLPERSARP